MTGRTFRVMTMALLTVAGLVIAIGISGLFPALSAAWRRRQKGQSMVERRPTSRRRAPMQSSGQRYGARH